MLFNAKVSHVENRGSPATVWVTLQVPFTASGQPYTGQLVLAVSQAEWEAESPGTWPPKVGTEIPVSLSLPAPVPAV